MSWVYITRAISKRIVFLIFVDTHVSDLTLVQSRSNDQVTFLATKQVSKSYGFIMAPSNHSISLVSLVDSHLPTRYFPLSSSFIFSIDQTSSQPPAALGEKPLPPLPRGWARVRHETSLFLRSIGLSVIVSTLSGLFNKNYKEPAKVAIRKNRVTAVLRTFSHLLPLALALLEIIINWRGYYYGGEFSRQAYYQIAAKAHEITMQASLALIVLSYIRYEITSSNGIPFGTFLGSLQFLQVSYLWSSELWSSIMAKNFLLRVKLTTLTLLVICGILATTVGPSSATLLIPRLITWPLEPSYFAVNGTFQDVWPHRIDGRNISEACASLSVADGGSLCPGGLWKELSLQYPTVFTSSDSYELQDKEQAVAIIVPGPLGQGVKNGITGQCLTSNITQQCGSMIQDIIMEGAYSVISEWESDIGFAKSALNLLHYVSKDYYQPYTLTSCFSDVITATNENDLIEFPRIAETWSELHHERETISFPDITKGKILNASGNRSEFRLEWLELPQRLFSDQVSGVVIIHPSETNSLLTNVTSCTLGAGWGTSSIVSDHTLQDDLFFSQMSDTPKDWPVQNEIPFVQDVALSIPNYANLSGFVYPQRRIALSKDWLEFLNPTIYVSETYSTTAMHSIFTSVPGFTDAEDIPQVLAVMLACGLARNGVELPWQGSSYPSQRNKFHLLTIAGF